MIIVPDGTGIKNYLYTKLFRSTKYDLILFHNFDDDTLDTITQKVTISKSVIIPEYKESVREKFLRELIHLSRLRHNVQKTNNPTILNFWRKGRKGIKLRLFYAAVVMTSKFIRSYKRILKLERSYQAALRRNNFFATSTSILKELSPDVIFCTHQRALKAPTLFVAARDQGIRTTTVIYSWDNLPKARLALKADKYFVWSEHMKNELKFFYPEIDSSRIIVTGTPQFEFYLNQKNIIPREDFFSSYGLDSEKKLICFSGDDTTTSPYDPEYLHDLAEAMTAQGMQEDFHLVFRRCPVDVSGRYDWVIEKFSDLIVEMPPLWNFNSEKWTAIYPTYDDVKLLVSLAKHAEVVINVGSTMALDFGMFGKPCIYINYDQRKDPNWSVDTIYKFHHFRSMPSSSAVYWFNDRSTIVHILKKSLEEPETTIREWQDVVVDHINSASDRILKELT